MELQNSNKLTYISSKKKKEYVAYVSPARPPVPTSDTGTFSSVWLGYFLVQNKVCKCLIHVQLSRIQHGYLRWNEEFEQH